MDPGSIAKLEIVKGPLGDDATTEQLGLFLQNQFSPTDRLHLTLTLGGRFNYASVDAKSVEEPGRNFVFSIRKTL